MILEALCGYYDRLIHSPGSGTARPDWARTPVCACIVLNGDGRVAAVRSLMESTGGRRRPVPLMVPMQPKRSGLKPEPAFLCDNGQFIFGINQKDDYRFTASREIHETVLGACTDPGAQAVLGFFEQRIKGRFDHYQTDSTPLLDGGNLVFALYGEEGYIHDRPAVQSAWHTHLAQQWQDAPAGQCLATGKSGPIARLHGNLTGFGPHKPTLVGFNQDAFTSYHKEQGMNAPVSRDAAFMYVTALNALIGDRQHRLNLHNDIVLIWSEGECPREERLVVHFFDPQTAIQKLNKDDDREFAGIFTALMSGKSPEDFSLDADARIYILGLSANKARVIIRLFHRDTFGAILQRIQDHYRDIFIAGNTGADFPSLYRLVRETAPRRQAGHVAPGTESLLLRSILDGDPYPYGIYHQILQRIRAEAGMKPQRSHGFALSRERAGYIKGFLNRGMALAGKDEKEMMTVSLDPGQTDPGYLLGRLFALVEKSQKDALGITCIADKYLSSALAAPPTVFPALLTLHKQYASKGGGHTQPPVDVMIGQVLLLFPDTGFPAALTPEEQGRFMIGYYHQNQALYSRKAAINPCKEEMSHV